MAGREHCSALGWALTIYLTNLMPLHGGESQCISVWHALQGIGNGLPLAAVVTTPEIAQTLAQRLHFNTYGGNPVCCAGGRAVLQAVDEDGIQANAAKVCERCQSQYFLDLFLGPAPPLQQHQNTRAF